MDNSDDIAIESVKKHVWRNSSKILGAEMFYGLNIGLPKNIKLFCSV